ncbi:MAG: hypothetical protein IPH75_13915 [bacterium]|nr:hypothetical protein [bacterium]
MIPPPDSGVSAVIDQQGNLLLSGQTIGNYTALVILTDNCGADTCEVNFSIIDDCRGDLNGNGVPFEASLRQISLAPK